MYFDILEIYQLFRYLPRLKLEKDIQYQWILLLDSTAYSKYNWNLRSNIWNNQSDTKHWLNPSFGLNRGQFL